jgi:hypothetical protein
MTDPIKVSLIIGGAIVAAMGIWIYFSPFHTCLRSMVAEGQKESAAAIYCGGNIK